MGTGAMKNLYRASLILSLLCLSTLAEAANRFWVPLVVTNAVSGTGGLCRLTVNDTTNLTAGSAVIVAAITGAVACDGTTTVTTVINATTVEVNLAFGVAYVSGGTVAGGNWTATGTGNWSATSGGAGGVSVPGAGDSVTFNGSSGGSTVVINSTISIVVLDIGSYTAGTLDFSVNNNSITIDSFSCNAGASPTLKMGSGTWTVTAASAPWDATGCTITANTSILTFTSTTSVSRQFVGAGKTYATVRVSPNTSGGALSFVSGTIVIGTFDIQPPNAVEFPTAGITISNPLAITGTSTNQIFLHTRAQGTAASVTIAAGSVASWVGIREVTFNTNTLVATNSFNLGKVTGATITTPTTGGGGHIIGGYLLWRDLLKHSNDNTPAWLQKAA